MQDISKDHAKNANAKVKTFYFVKKPKYGDFATRDKDLSRYITKI
jgi:hypothetical protein